MLSKGTTLTVMVLPVSVLTKICVASALSGYSNQKLSERLPLIVDMRLTGTTSL